jgi:hypothetical protein
MAKFRLALLSTLILCTSCSHEDFGPPPATVGTSADLFASLEGESCQGGVYSGPPIPGYQHWPIAVGNWFTKADGSAWVKFKFGDQRMVARPVLLTASGLEFTGSGGAKYSLQGNAVALAGPAWLTDGLHYVIHVNCAKRQPA